MPENHQLTPDDRDDIREFIVDLSDVLRLAEVFPGVVTPAGMARVLPESLRPELARGLTSPITDLAISAREVLDDWRSPYLDPDSEEVRRNRKAAQIEWNSALSHYIATVVLLAEEERIDTASLESAVVEGWEHAELESSGAGPVGHGAVYVITTPEGQYVGQSTQPMPRRWRQHQRAAQASSHLPIHVALAATLPHLFGCRFEVVEVARSAFDLDLAEQRWIDKISPTLNSRNQAR